MAQIGDAHIQSFPPAAYQSDSYISSPQNWAVIQDDRGVIYVSNTSGVLEYDGISWRLVHGTANTGRFQLAKNSDGRIFLGSNSDFGYLAPDSVGRMQFISLMHHLKHKYPELKIGKIATLGQEVYFSTQNNVFRWSGKKFNVWHSKAGFGRIYQSENKLYAIDKEKGLSVLERNRFQPVLGGKSLKDLNVVSLLPLPDTEASKPHFLVVTYDEGLFSFKDQKLEEFVTEPSEVLSQEFFMHATPLVDGTIALATITGGVVILDQKGKIKKSITKENGLNDNAALHLYVDMEGALWAALNKGISRIDYPSPLTYLSEPMGLDGIALSILKQENRLYVGTSSGLYFIDESTYMPEFQKHPHLQAEVWKLLQRGDTLLVVSSPGVYVLENTVLKQISPQTEGVTYKTIQQSAFDQNKYYVGSSDGLAVVTHRKGKWKWEGEITAVNHDVIWLATDKTGTLWASCNDNISAIDDSKAHGLQPPVRNFKPSAELANELRSFQVYSIQGNIYFGTSKGIYSLQKQGDSYQLKPDASLGVKFADGSREAINLSEGNNGDIWLTSEFRTGQLVKLQNSTYVWDTTPLSRIPRVDVWTIYTDPQGIVWLGTTEGIIRYNPLIPKDYKDKHLTLLRKVKLSGDSTVFYGAFSENGQVSLKQSPRFKFTLPHAISSISFEYAATSYDAPGQLMYSYMLEGQDQNWSHWTTETKKEYTGLDEGDYVFRVKSRNIYGIQSQEATFSFASLPPFYRTWWAYLFYVLLWGSIIWGVFKAKHRNLIASKRRLEKLVQKRTVQLQTEKKKSDDLLLNILPVEIADELKLKGRAEARSYEAATVLFTDFKDFTKISENLTPEELVAVIDFYFCAFDKIIAKYNIEKIKTIGDSYMCAGGIPNPDANTPADVVKAGLEILAFVKSLNPDNYAKKHKFEIRIGIHTGPVVAGIVGTQKFAYDIWGDTVNTAACMESSCKEGEINISGATYEIIKDEFVCYYRGKIDAKNKGAIDMYFVEEMISKEVYA
ncbi:adenylate/guanylate cyclase domain-containing protein [Pontibacter akesuensis]|nr:adenylate/guanylate cyclase domain-containing protein [Pontibacter akesuensis]GHA62025.1 hypothetical protein GCM10007389_13310 [Pontibacter akesuensis]